jgi:hypothetical protein
LHIFDSKGLEEVPVSERRNYIKITKLPPHIAAMQDGGRLESHEQLYLKNLNANKDYHLCIIPKTVLYRTPISSSDGQMLPYSRLVLDLTVQIMQTERQKSRYEETAAKLANAGIDMQEQKKERLRDVLTREYCESTSIKQPSPMQGKPATSLDSRTVLRTTLAGSASKPPFGRNSFNSLSLAAANQSAASTEVQSNNNQAHSQQTTSAPHRRRTPRAERTAPPSSFLTVRPEQGLDEGRKQKSAGRVPVEKQQRGIDTGIASAANGVGLSSMSGQPGKSKKRDRSPDSQDALEIEQMRKRRKRLADDQASNMTDSR